MKKLNYLLVVVLLVVNIITISCTKQSSPYGTGYTTPPDDELPGGFEIGSIIDLGPINSETRAMLATFIVPDYWINEDEVSGGTAIIDVIYYVNEDNVIPDGEYFFSNSDSKSPFTFDSAVISGAIDSNGYPVPDSQVVDGSVIVSLNSNEYLFEFQSSLESGVMFRGSVRGVMQYSDNHIYSDDNTDTGDTTN